METKIDKIINWFKGRIGKIMYSMEYRTGPNSYDCSSSLYYAICNAFEIQNKYPVNTENLHEFLLENGFEKITENKPWQARRGDIFIWGKQGFSSGSYGHTGIFVDCENIIHCNYRNNGISVDNHDNLWFSSGKPYYYAYRFNYENEFESMLKVSERYLINKNYNIYSLPACCDDKTIIGTTSDYLGFVVTITRKLKSYWYSQYLGGWVDCNSFTKIETVDFVAKIIRKNFSVDTLPWGMNGFTTIYNTDKLFGQKFNLTAKYGAYYYIHSIAKWVDEKAFELNR